MLKTNFEKRDEKLQPQPSNNCRKEEQSKHLQDAQVLLHLLLDHLMMWQHLVAHSTLLHLALSSLDR
jgi:hypothetical protein